METGLPLEDVLSVLQPRKERPLGIAGSPFSIPDQETRLVEDCRSGSLEAYEKLYELHGARMKSIALNLLGNREDAEDAVQEAFLKIYRSINGFKGESAFSTWVFRILVNACCDLARKQRRRKAEVPDAGLDPDLLNRSASRSSDHPLRLALEQSLGRLGERARTVFLLFEVEGFKHREIAGILAIPEGTSKNLLFEAKKELQRLLAMPLRSARCNDEARV